MRCGLAYRIDWASRSLTLVTAQEISADSRETMRQLDLGDPFLGDAIASGTVESVGLDGQSESPLFQRLGAAGIQSALLVPLLARQHPVGLMILAGATTGLCPVPSRELFGSIGHQVGLAMENALLYHQAQEAAIVEERQRLARDLHDSVTQSLYGATLYARAASRLLEHEAVPQAREHLDEVQTSVQQALQEMRLMIFELRPSILEEEGLALALRNRLQAVESRAGLETATDLDEDLELDEDVEEALYLVALEALNNGLKHAQAQHVGLTLKRQNGHVLLEVRDDGRGFSPASADERGGFGWHGMHERAARIGAHLTVDSAPGQGTVVRLELPT
jgi:signal transduction histidine kinase